MLNKIANVISGGNANNNPAPPSLPTTANSITFTPVTAVKPSSYVEKRQFSVVLKHRFDDVNAQVEHGLLHVKRTCNFAETILKVLEHSSDARKLTAALTAQWAEEPLQDTMTHFVTAGAMMGEVLLHTYTAHEKFRESAQRDAVTPLYMWYKSAQARRREVVKDHTRMLSVWQSMEESLNKERRECAKAYTELRLAADAKDKEEANETSSKDVFPRLVKKWKAQKETCVKKFQAFEQAYHKAQALQKSNDAVSLPAMLAELEQLEKERLQHTTEYLLKFQELYRTWAADLKSSSDLINKVVPSLNAEKSITTMLDKFCGLFGPPPQMVLIRYDLPCTASAVNADTLPLDSAPLLAYLSGGSAAPSAAGGSGQYPSAATLRAQQSASPMPRDGTPSPMPTGRTPAPLPTPVVRPLPQVANAATPIQQTPSVTGIVQTPPPPVMTGAAGSFSSSSVAIHPLPSSTGVAAGHRPPPPPPAIPTPAAAVAPVKSMSPPPAVAGGHVPPPPPGAPSSAALSTAASAVASTSPSPAAAATATPAVVSASTVRPQIGLIGRQGRAPPPSLPQKRKPKGSGDADDPNPNDLPAPPLPPPVQVTSSAFHRASVTRRSMLVRQSVSGAPGVRQSVSSLSRPLTQNPRPSTVERTPPPPPPLPSNHSAAAAATPPAVPTAPRQRLSIFGVNLDPASRPSISSPTSEASPQNGDSSASNAASVTPASPLVARRAPPPRPDAVGQVVNVTYAAPVLSTSRRNTVSGVAPRLGEATTMEMCIESMDDPVMMLSVPTGSGELPTVGEGETNEADPDADGVLEQDPQPAVAVFDFNLSSEDTDDIHYLAFYSGDSLVVIHQDEDWWYGELHGDDGAVVDQGYFPSNYVRLLEDAEQQQQ